MRLKPGASIRGMKSEALWATNVADGIAKAHGHELVITSGSDGSHSRGSAHYAGNAFDMRDWWWQRPEQEQVAAELARALDADFDVVLEDNHIHVEFDPKTPLNR